MYRAFGDGAGAGTAAITRRCLLRNHGATPAQFRLTLPSGGAFVVRGEAVAAATADTAEIPAGGTCSLAVEFTPPPSGDEFRAELVVRMPGQVLGVPLVALRHERTPSGGDPNERRERPTVREHWRRVDVGGLSSSSGDDDDDDDDSDGLTAAPPRPAAAAAGVSQEELDSTRR